MCNQKCCFYADVFWAVLALSSASDGDWLNASRHVHQSEARSLLEISPYPPSRKISHSVKWPASCGKRYLVPSMHFWMILEIGTSTLVNVWIYKLYRYFFTNEIFVKLCKKTFIKTVSRTEQGCAEAFEMFFAGNGIL